MYQEAKVLIIVTMTQMNYKTFHNFITRLLEIRRDEENLNKALKKFSPDFNYLCFSKQETLTEDILKEAMNDKSDWIGYWMFELNEGKDYKKGSVVVDGKNVPLKTIRDLYNILK